MSNEDKAHIEADQEVIREYLIGQFKGFELIDKSDGPFGHLLISSLNSA
jgi:hypothetical protein